MDGSAVLDPYVPNLATTWLREQPSALWREVHGSLAFVDISGFTQLTERLAREGKVGAERMSDILNATFAHLLEVAYRDGGEPGEVGWRRRPAAVPGRGARGAGRAGSAPDAGTAATDRPAQHAERARRRCGCRSGSTAAPSTSSSSATRPSTASCSSAGPAASVTADIEAWPPPARSGSARGPRPCSPRLVGGPRARPAARRRAAARRPGVRGPDVIRGLDLAALSHRRSARTCRRPPARRSTARSPSRSCSSRAPTRCSPQQGPRCARRRARRVVRNVQHAAARHGVTFFESDIDRDGGKIMLTAGAPLSPGHDEERLLRAARQIVDRARHAARSAIGVNRGPVFAGDFGPPFRRTYSVKGDAINLAARVHGQGAAGPAARHRRRSRALGQPVRRRALAAVPCQGKVGSPSTRPSVGVAAGVGAGASGARHRTGRARRTSCAALRRRSTARAPAAEPSWSSSASRGSASPGWSRSCCARRTSTRS